MYAREWEFRRALQHEGKPVFRTCEGIGVRTVADSRLGTSARVQAFLDKARSGKAFTVASIGGSGMCLQDLYMYVQP